ncbi:ABC transporter permease [Hydrogenophaga sp.]|uniref:ABC transporter permease n=1 Tax=Hydrogenophaga sp. TaxID=1904254 RepID=UPI00271E2409|nr:ABC transporter permease [Hydrogenophaga sp.]MDO9436268.1 ABC transporter permease [Hydrogenophaga sp.]
MSSSAEALTPVPTQPIATSSGRRSEFSAVEDEPRRRPSLGRRLLGNGPALASFLFLVLLVLVSLTAPWLAPYSPIEQDISQALQAPSWQHWLGMDDLGRDVLSRLLWGTSNSLYASVLAVSTGIVLGVPLGLLIGFVGGRVDEVVSRLIDALLAFPPIVLAIAVTGVLGIGLTNAMLAVGFVFAPHLTRLARAQTLVVKSSLYIEAARSAGATNLQIVLRHVLPNAIQPVLVQVTLMLAIALLAEASLSFLSLGVQPPAASWGGMLARAYSYLELAPGQMYAPGIAIGLTALAFNTLGEFLRAALDPTHQG